MKHSIELYKDNRYKVISERMIEVDGNLVTRKVKKGRVVLTCSCQNHSHFPNESFCRHKKFFVLFPLLDKFNKKIDNLINEYSVGKSILKTDEGKNITEQIINDLKKLK